MSEQTGALDLLIIISRILATGIDDQSIATATALILADRKTTVEKCKEKARAWYLDIMGEDEEWSDEEKNATADDLCAALDAVLEDQ